MAARADSNNTWSYGSSGSIWEGRAGVVTQTRPTNNDEPVWRGWQGAPRAATASQEFVERDSQHSEYGLNPVATSYSGHLPQETESTTLYMGNLEPWMDHEYISQVVRLMGWNRAPDGLQTLPVTIKISAPPIDPISHTNNPGYCLLIFPSPSHAAHILTSLQAANNRNQSGQPLLMPNSSRPFSLQWATVTQLSYANSAPTFGASGPNGPTSNSMNSFSVFPPHASQSQKEYSIFVGDLAPETSNSDLVAVFRNPVLGLRNDREPKFIRPFYSCKSAKIMLDPVSGVSRGYGFVRFTDEADQQRALIEMHGLYCLSRPMRVSPATAKFKLTASGSPPSMGREPLTVNVMTLTQESSDNSGARPNLFRSVSSPIATVSIANDVGMNTMNTNPTNGNDPVTNKDKPRSLGPAAALQLRDYSLQPDGQIAPHVLAHIKNLAAGDAPKSQDWPSGQLNSSHYSSASIDITPSVYPPNLQHQRSGSSLTGNNMGYDNNIRIDGGLSSSLYTEAWRHQAQARAILGNLIGPNGEQLTSTDPYNTTVFVGGLSPLISEETLRTFFAPFGDIHYVKVPLGKHCGFVQFVRKADAECAIERMQGFPIGGSRIRLSWGRSQYKAAQAAAQAAQAAQAEQTKRLTEALLDGQSPVSLQIPQEQAFQLLQSFGHNSVSSACSISQTALPSTKVFHPEDLRLSTYVQNGSAKSLNPFVSAQTEKQCKQFSPFSPSTAPNNILPTTESPHRSNPRTTPSPSSGLAPTSRGYIPSFGPTSSAGSTKIPEANSRTSPHSSASSSESSARYSGLAGAGHHFGGGLVENPNGTFQATDILRNDDSQSLFHWNQMSSSPETNRLTTPPRLQQAQQQSQLRVYKEEPSHDSLHGLNGSLAKLDLDSERYQRGVISGETFSEDAYEHRRVQNNTYNYKPATRMASNGL